MKLHSIDGGCMKKLKRPVLIMGLVVLSIFLFPGSLSWAAGCGSTDGYSPTIIEEKDTVTCSTKSTLPQYYYFYIDPAQEVEISLTTTEGRAKFSLYQGKGGYGSAYSSYKTHFSAKIPWKYWTIEVMPSFKKPSKVATFTLNVDAKGIRKKVDGEACTYYWDCRSGNCVERRCRSKSDAKADQKVQEKSLNSDLIKAAKAGDMERVSELIRKGANVNAKDKYDRIPLMHASRKGHKEVVKLLISKGANVTAKDKNGVTVLMNASNGGNKEIAGLLISKGADVNARSGSRRTVLMGTSQQGHKEVAELLISKGADVNAKGTWGWTALMDASKRGHQEMAELLVSKGADVNAKHKYVGSPLVLAAKNGHKGIVELLVSKGADVNAKEKDGKTALMIAEQKGYQEIVNVLRSRSKVFIGKRHRYTLERTVKVDSKVFDVYETGVKTNNEYARAMIVTDQDGTIKRDKYLMHAGYADMLYRRLTSDKAFRLNLQQQKNIEDFLWWESQAQVALFFRDAASRALVDVGIIYMTGNTSQLTKQVAKEIAKDALKNTAMDIIKNPDNYLRAVMVKMLADSLYELRWAERKARDLKGRIVSYDELVELEDVTTRAYSNVVPSFKLIKELSPKADILSQIQDTVNTMKSKFLVLFPGGEGYIRPAEAKNMYQRLGGLIDEIYKRYQPYIEYQKQKQEVESHIKKDLESAQKIVKEKLENGIDLTAGYTRFVRE